MNKRGGDAVAASLESLALTERAHPGKEQELMPGTPIRAVPDIEGREEKPTEPHGGGKIMVLVTEITFNEAYEEYYLNNYM